MTAPGLLLRTANVGVPVVAGLLGRGPLPMVVVTARRLQQPPPPRDPSPLVAIRPFRRSAPCLLRRARARSLALRGRTTGLLPARKMMMELRPVRAPDPCRSATPARANTLAPALKRARRGLPAGVVMRVQPTLYAPPCSLLHHRAPERAHPCSAWSWSPEARSCRPRRTRCPRPCWRSFSALARR